jgi:hypothetical protein
MYEKSGKKPINGKRYLERCTLQKMLFYACICLRKGASYGAMGGGRGIGALYNLLSPLFKLPTL